MPVKTKVYLETRVRERKSFMELANEIRDDLSKGTWNSSETGLVWTHSQHGGKVKFLTSSYDEADSVKIWQPEEAKKRFKLAQAIGNFVQWIFDNVGRQIRKIEIIEER